MGRMSTLRKRVVPKGGGSCLSFYRGLRLIGRRLEPHRVERWRAEAGLAT